MNKNRRNQIVLGAVGLIAVWALVRGSTVPVGRGNGSGETASGPSQVSQVSIPSPGPFSRESQVRTHVSGWGRSPFELVGGGAMGAKGLALNGIVWDENFPLAMINDQVLGVGEKIDNRQIKKITRTEVTLEEQGREFILTLGEN